MSIIVTGDFVAQIDQLDQALALSVAHVQRSRSEAGCIAHRVHQDVEQPARLVFVEEWESQAALKAHFAVAASRQFAAEVTALAERPPKMRIFQAEEIGAN